MRIFFFLLKEGFRGLVRSKYAGAFSIIIIWISLILVGIGYVGARDMIFAVDNIRSQFDVDIFIHKSANQEEINKFANKLKNMVEIEEVNYISPDSAAKRFHKEFGEDIFDLLEMNPLPPSFTIQLRNIYRNLISIESISRILSKDNIVDEIKYRKKILYLLDKYQRIALSVILLVFASLTLISVILVSNSIKMTIFARRDIISTLKLVGATDNFVKAPFIIEGALQGMIGASLSAGIIYSLFYLLNTQFTSVFDYRAVVSIHFYIFLIIGGSILGISGSTRAIKKFLS